MASRKDTRLEMLKSTLTERRSLHIRDAAELLDVSEMTVRRDVSENPSHFSYLGGHIVQTDPLHGGAPYELAQEADLNKEEKRLACRHCLPYLQPEETLFVDCGTTLVHLIDVIPQDMRLTVVCYALNTADRITRKPNITLIMLGGEYHPSTGSFAALPGDEMFGAIAINTAFLSAAGIDRQHGATCINFHEALWKRAAIEKSQQSILIADSSKIGRVRPAFFGPLAAFDRIVTEEGALSFEDDDAA